MKSIKLSTIHPQLALNAKILPSLRLHHRKAHGRNFIVKQLLPEVVGIFRKYSKKVTEDKFGIAQDPLTKKKEEIRRFTLSNDKNMSVQIMTRGATITSIKVPDINGCIEDVVLGYEDVTGYLTDTCPYFGATVGRVCNRIALGKFKIGEKEYNVGKNKIKHSLHGGFIGFDKVHWEVLKISDGLVSMQHCSPDGHEGYPGDLTAKVHFKLTKDNQLKIRFEAETTEATPVNMTNHSYFNLAGHDSGSKGIYEHLITIKADKITEKDEDGIPTGCFTAVDGTGYDLRTIGNLGERLKKILPALGFDDNYCVNLGNGTTKVARVLHPPTGRWLEVISDQPGLQFYTGNFLGAGGDIIGKSDTKYVKHSAFCLETQKYPNSVNINHFPSTILYPDKKYAHEVTYKFGVFGDVK